MRLMCDCWHGEAIGRQAAGQFGLAQGGAAFLLVELARFLDAQARAR
jgi:hypothetical protein